MCVCVCVCVGIYVNSKPTATDVVHWLLLTYLLESFAGAAHSEPPPALLAGEAGIRVTRLGAAVATLQLYRGVINYTVLLYIDAQNLQLYIMLNMLLLWFKTLCYSNEMRPHQSYTLAVAGL